MDKPKCKVCQKRHWPNEPHDLRISIEDGEKMIEAQNRGKNEPYPDSKWDRKYTTTIYLPKELHRKLKQKATEKGTSMSKMIEEFVETL